jgi:hypothetical protein
MTTPSSFKRVDLEKIILTNINEFGWHAVNVIENDAQPPWSYTIGLYDTWSHPELIIIGRSRATAQHMLATIVTELEYDRRPDLNLPDDNVLPGSLCHFIEVHPRYYPDYVGFARWYYRKRTFPMMQIVWPNTDGQYPWEEDAPESFKEWQPMLGSSPLADSRRRF